MFCCLRGGKTFFFDKKGAKLAPFEYFLLHLKIINPTYFDLVGLKAFKEG